jgi:hypothetical protein
MDPRIVRRVVDEEQIKEKLEEIIEFIYYENIRFDSSYDFIEEVCDMIVNDIIVSFEGIIDRYVTPKEKDDLYFYFLDNYKKFISTYYTQIV